jgi:two-component system OmpR family sensor kinase
VNMLSSARSKTASLGALPDRLPLRVQLVVMVLVLVVVALAVAGFAGTHALRGYLLERVDDQLHDTARGAIASGRLPGALRGAPREFDGPALTESFYAQVVDADGRGDGVLRTPSDSEQTEPELPDLALDTAVRLDQQPFTVDPRGAGERWRVLVDVLPEGSGALVVATSLNDIESTISRLVLIQLIVGTIVLLVVGFAGYATVRSSLRRLAHVEQTAAAIAAGDLTQRVDAGDERTEIGRLGAALNTMLSQIETAFSAQRESEQQARASEEKMRRFVADASHELRTPLTSIRGFAELQRQVAADLDIDERNRLTSRIEAEAARMGLLVEDLLLLARLDQQRPLERQPVDLSAVVEDLVADAPAISTDHPILLTTDDTAGPAVVMGDQDRLRQVFLNLVSNAFTHTPAGTNVEVSVRTSHSDVFVCVRDDGQGMTEEDAARVFERFFRSDPSRTRASGGSGLGLSIVAALVAAHGGSVEVETSPGNGASFVVQLPRMHED